MTYLETWPLAWGHARLQSYTKMPGGVNMVCVIGRKLWLVILVAKHTVSLPPVMRSMPISLSNHNRKNIRDIHFEVICAAWSAWGGHLVKNKVIWQHLKTPINFTSLLWFTCVDLSLKLLKCVWMNVALSDPDTTSLNLPWSNVKLCRICVKTLKRTKCKIVKLFFSLGQIQRLRSLSHSTGM